VQLYAVGGPATGPTQFTAFRPNGTTRSEFLATKSGLEKAGDVKVGFFRSVALNGPGRTFTFSNDLSSARVAPPSPFTESANFASPSTWGGSLEVSFPGEKHVELAAPGFGATLGRGKF
jgi:hypothetical protein